MRAQDDDECDRRRGPKDDVPYRGPHFTHEALMILLREECGEGRKDRRRIRDADDREWYRLQVERERHRGYRTDRGQGRDAGEDEEEYLLRGERQGARHRRERDLYDGRA